MPFSLTARVIYTVPGHLFGHSITVDDAGPQTNQDVDFEEYNMVNPL